VPDHCGTPEAPPIDPLADLGHDHQDKAPTQDNASAGKSTPPTLSSSKSNVKTKPLPQIQYTVLRSNPNITFISPVVIGNQQPEMLVIANGSVGREESV